jgi:hypothetical protein
LSQVVAQVVLLMAQVVAQVAQKHQLLQLLHQQIIL